MRGVLLDNFCWLTSYFVHERRSRGQFSLIDSSFCPREPPYWTVSSDRLIILSTRAVLLDSFSWLSLHFVRERRSIGQFLLIDFLFCPREPFYWTVFTNWPLILSTRTVLLDSFSWLTSYFVHENRSIGQFFLIDSLFCPREPFVTTEKSHFFYVKFAV